MSPLKEDHLMKGRGISASPSWRFIATVVAASAQGALVGSFPDGLGGRNQLQEHAEARPWSPR